MKQLLFLLLLCPLQFVFSQEDDQFSAYILSGVTLHDEGKYDEAIQEYEKALALRPNSSTALYEISYSYLEKEEYDKAIAYSDQVLKINDENKFAAYIIKGTALDLSGKTEESIEVFLKGIDDVGPHYLLYYNLAVNYGALKDYENAIANVKESLTLNPTHINSHYLLTKSEFMLDNKVQTILAASLFLYFENEDPRGEEVYEILSNCLKGNVDESAEGNKVITLDINQDLFYGSMEMMISIMESTDSDNITIEGEESVDEEQIEKEKEIIVETLFDNRLNFLLSMFCERYLDDDAPDDIYANLHGPLFYAFKSEDILEVVTNIILSRYDEDAQNWLDLNQDEVQNYLDYLEQLND